MEEDRALVERIGSLLRNSQQRFDRCVQHTHTSLEAQAAQHAKTLAVNKENASAQKKRAAAAKTKSATLARVAAAQNTELAALQGKVKEVSASVEELTAQETALQATLDELEREHRALLQEVQGKGAQSQERQMELNEGVGWYEQRLGWQMAKKEVDVVTMTFTLIDPKDPARPFSFDLMLLADNAYSVDNVRPSVKGVEPLLEELNRTTNFAQFMWQMRTLFQQAALRVP